MLQSALYAPVSLLSTLATVLGEGSRMSTKGEEKTSVEYLINVHGHQEQKSSDHKEIKNWKQLPEGLYGAVHLLGLGNRQTTPQPKLSLGL